MLIEKQYTGRNKWNQKIWEVTLVCDECSLSFVEDYKNTKKKLLKRTEHLCNACLSILTNKIAGDRMRNYKANLSKEQKKLESSMGGKAAQKSGKCSSGWFTTERWDSMTIEQQNARVIKANSAAMEKLKQMSTDELAAHYTKVLKGGIGFISKGQQELIDSLLDSGFIGNVQISNMNVDCCNHDFKIVVEYNGDAYHCNPKYWREGQYSTLIKMTAREKWQKDRNRYAVLRKMGYRVIVVWESDWLADKNSIIKRIKSIYETSKDRTNRKADLL